MINDWLNQNPEDGFDPNDHGIEMDEIAKLHAMADMKSDQEIWAREQANKFYNDFESLKKVLKSAGFKNIKLWDWKNVDHCINDDYSQSYIPHMDKENGVLMSLNIECQKIS